MSVRSIFSGPLNAPEIAKTCPLVAMLFAQCFGLRFVGSSTKDFYIEIFCLFLEKVDIIEFFWHISYVFKASFQIKDGEVLAISGAFNGPEKINLTLIPWIHSSAPEGS